MDERLAKRLAQQASQGLGSALPEMQKISKNLTDEEAKEAAEEADVTKMFKGENEEPEEEKEEEIPPPDKEAPTEEEIKTAAEILRMVKTPEAQHNTSRYTDPLAEASDRLREDIEKKLKPIDVSDLLFHGTAMQEVEICDGINVTLKSLRGHHFTLLDKWIYREFDSAAYVVRNRMRHFTGVAITIHRINGNIPAGLALPDDDNTQDFIGVDPENYYSVFRSRLSWLQNMNPSIIDLFCMHVTWFEQRVRKVLANHLYLGQEIKK